MWVEMDRDDALLSYQAAQDNQHQLYVCARDSVYVTSPKGMTGLMLMQLASICIYATEDIMPIWAFF